MTSRLLALLVLSLLGCDSATEADAGPGTPIDSGVSDSGVSDSGVSDSGAAVDAGPSAMDAGALDAGVSDAGRSDAGSSDAGSSDAGIADAGPFDAGSLSPADVCDALCTRLQICTGAPASEFARCIGDCTTDLADCSASELGELRGCERAPDACALDPVTMVPKALQCIQSVACVDG